MKKLLPCLISFFFCEAVISQTFQWVETPPIVYGLNPDMIGYANTSDSNGNVYFAGFKEASYLYSTDIMGNLYFNKYTSDGSLIFSKSFGGNGTVYKMETDPDGNVIMAMGYVSTVTIGDQTISTTAQGVRPLLLKFDDNGNLLWQQELSVTGSNVGNFRAIDTDAAGNIYIGYDTYNHSYITKLSPSGTADLTITQLNVKRITSVSVDTEGNIYAAGSCAENNASYAGIPVPTNLSYNSYISKYSPAGTYQWVKYVDDITCSEPKVHVNTPDQVYLCSHLYGAYAFDGITAEGPMQGMFNDFFLAKLDASGAFQWVREVPGTGAVVTGHRDYMAVDSNGNAYVGGYSSGNINWGNGITSSSQGGTADAFVVGFTSEGNIMMAKTFGGISQDRVDNVSVTNSGALIVSGMTRGVSNFDAINFTPSEVAYYPFIGKIESALQTNNFEMASAFVFPNPVSDQIYYSGNEIIHGSIFNILGQKVQDIVLQKNSPANVGGLANGFYTIKSTSNGNLKFIKQ